MLISLLQENALLLETACTAMAHLDNSTWTTSPLPGVHRAGPQFRHIIEFYDCLLDQVPHGRIDYDARRRDTRIEASVEFAAGRMRDLIERLRRDPTLREDRELVVRMEDAPPGSNVWFASSLGRELQSVRTHTIHHFALVAITFRAWGIPVDNNFGVAPSTLRFREGTAQKEAA